MKTYLRRWMRKDYFWPPREKHKEIFTFVSGRSRGAFRFGLIENDGDCFFRIYFCGWSWPEMLWHTFDVDAARSAKLLQVVESISLPFYWEETQGSIADMPGSELRIGGKGSYVNIWWGVGSRSAALDALQPLIEMIGEIMSEIRPIFREAEKNDDGTLGPPINDHAHLFSWYKYRPEAGGMGVYRFCLTDKIEVNFRCLHWPVGSWRGFDLCRGREVKEFIKIGKALGLRAMRFGKDLPLTPDTQRFLMPHYPKDVDVRWMTDDGLAVKKFGRLWTYLKRAERKVGKRIDGWKSDTANHSFDMP